MTNNEIAKIFNETADILEIKGENIFRVRAYRNAARVIDNLIEKLSDIVAQNPDELNSIKSIGKALHDKIIEFCQTGKIKEFDNLKNSLPSGLLDMLKIQSFGPKRVRLVYEKLGIDNVDKLEKAASEGKIRVLPGMGEKSELKILKSIRDFRTLQTDRKSWAEAEQILNDYLNYLKKIDGIDKIQPAGSFRRCRETVGDLDILITCSGDTEKIISHFAEYPEVLEILAQGETKSSVVLKDKIQVDLRVVKPESFGAAMQYFTGSKEHNVALRSHAKEKNMKLSEYGVFQKDKSIAGENEENVYNSLGFDWIPPEIRENRGEIAMAKNHSLPKLITLENIKGDLHCHSTHSDGSATIPEMAAAAKRLGYEYLAITDHSKSLTVAHGLDERRLLEEITEIDVFREQNPDFFVFKGIEVDILADGSLDLDDEILSKLNFPIAAIHSRFGMGSAEMTERIVRAIKNPFIRCVAHPTGRLIGERVPYEIDIAKIIAAAKENNVALEINASPHRLDMNENFTFQAREAGVPICINTDSHSPDGFLAMRYGINVARRAWCTTENIVNAWSLEKLKSWLKLPREKTEVKEKQENMEEQIQEELF
ncbi:MAG: DNA polymerase/3'-5' exonuclease PolX [Chlamydiae bacterium]|nr:MAG: DNA polymerase/3'-5' exonuclease PolX [Chlamydiota bacterium]